MSPTDKREHIIAELQVIQKKEQQDRNVFKARAYTKVIQQLQERTAPVYGWTDLAEIQGIGEGIRKKIQEVLDTGVIANAEAIRKESGFGAKERFLKVYGIGPVKAKALVDAGFRTIEELRTAVEKDGKLLNEKQKIGLRYYEDIEERIPRAEMDLHAAMLQKTAEAAIKIPFSLAVVGSYRRKAPTSGDIDVLISFPDAASVAEATGWFVKFREALREKKYLEEALAEGPKKWMGMCRLRGNPRARRLDMLLTPKEEYAYALLYFTGSDKFNIAMRRRALDKGYTMNEHGMESTKKKEAPPFMKTEEDIFKFLEIPYVAPENRDGKKIV